MHATIDGFEIPPYSLKEVVILANKVSLSGSGHGAAEMARFLSWLKSLKTERKVTFSVGDGTENTQGRGTIKYLARAGKTDESGTYVKFIIRIWL